MQKLAHYLWFKSKFVYRLLLPLSWCYALVVIIRQRLFQFGFLHSYRSKVPVLIVGNITVGGNGKTPVVLWIIEQLKKYDIEVGVISRGYGANPPFTPFLVADSNDPKVTGDEPMLIYERTGVDVVISPNRQKAIELILQRSPDVKLIISDDGLQHYALKRDIEWVVIDAKKQFGNKHFLPAGPLRESIRRLRSIDAAIINYGSNKTLTQNQSIVELPSSIHKAFLFLEPFDAVNLLSGDTRKLSDFTDVNAIAGIGFPERFYTLLQENGINVVDTKDFKDHHIFEHQDLVSFKKSNLPLFMTEKDAQKCKILATDNWWYVPVKSVIPAQSGEVLINQLLKKLH
ncbi:tetraacyldisaccharide 4'-kinase [Thorsellia kenyensis]|uniref:Tetraacyldisaccharide 4'-kinase n=1 Tax=Thorsellia kenyensis TaxID=1549888 RepID=A0ABV6CDX7_9GAMM